MNYALKLEGRALGRAPVLAPRQRWENRERELVRYNDNIAMDYSLRQEARRSLEDFFRRYEIPYDPWIYGACEKDVFLSVKIFLEEKAFLTFLKTRESNRPVLAFFVQPDREEEAWRIKHYYNVDLPVLYQVPTTNWSWSYWFFRDLLARRETTPEESISFDDNWTRRSPLTESNLFGYAQGIPHRYNPKAARFKKALRKGLSLMPLDMRPAIEILEVPLIPNIETSDVCKTLLTKKAS